MSQPAAPDVVEYAYGLVPTLGQYDSDDTKWPALTLLAGLLAGDQILYDLLESPGLAAFLAPEVAPAEWLLLAADCNGALIDEAMTTDQRRVEVRTPSGWARCLPSTILINAAEHLVEEATPVLLQRWHPTRRGDEPYHATLLVPYDDILPGHLDALRAVVQAGVVGGDRGWVIHTTWAAEAAAHTTWSSLAAAHTTWSSLAEGHPS